MSIGTTCTMSLFIAPATLPFCLINVIDQGTVTCMHGCLLDPCNTYLKLCPSLPLELLSRLSLRPLKVQLHTSLLPPISKDCNAYKVFDTKHGYKTAMRTLKAVHGPVLILLW